MLEKTNDYTKGRGVEVLGLLLESMCAATELELYKKRELENVRTLSGSVGVRDDLVAFYTKEVDRVRNLKETLRKEFLGEELYNKFKED